MGIVLLFGFFFLDSVPQRRLVQVILMLWKFNTQYPDRPRRFKTLHNKYEELKILSQMGHDPRWHRVKIDWMRFSCFQDFASYSDASEDQHAGYRSS